MNNAIRIIKIFLTIQLLMLGMITCSMTATAADKLSVDDLSKLSLEDLMQVVMTPSRNSTTIEEAPSPITVISAEQIKQQGLKSLRDVLDRLPGVYNQLDSSFSLVGIRGYVQNPTNNVLLMIDGHSINSQAGDGIGNTHLLPFLYQVKQIEIVRGPGSTLWGGDAAFGIVNIITYDGADLAESGGQFLQASVDYEFDLERRVGNILYGRNFLQGDLMMSASFTEAEGNYLNIYDVYTDDIKQLNTRERSVRHDQHRPSYEVQAKGHWYDLFFNSRLFEHKGYNRDGRARNFRFDFIEVGYSPEISDRWLLETSVYFNDIDETVESATIKIKQAYNEVGGSIITTYNPDNHILKTGLEVKDRDFAGRTVSDGGTFLNPASIKGRETNYALFSDYTYRGMQDWQFTLGARLQHFDLRQEGDYFVPRAAVIYWPSDHWTVKYMYNSGVVGTTLTRTGSTPDNYIAQSDGRILLGAEKAQETRSHDLLFTFAEDEIQANLGFFYQELDNYIGRTEGVDTGTVIDGHPVFVREDNLGDLSSYGFELDWTWDFHEHWNLYGNYAYAQTEFDDTVGLSARGGFYDLTDRFSTPDGELTGVPDHLWNLGLTYAMTNHSTLNVHYRGWSDAWGRQNTSIPPLFEHYGPEHFVDAAITFPKLFQENMSLQVYARNLFNNKAIIPMTVHAEIAEGNGAEYGLSLSYTF